MKNHTILIASLVVGAAVTAGLAYLFLTGDGEELRSKLSSSAKAGLKDLASGIVSDKTGISKKTLKKVAGHVVE